MRGVKNKQFTNKVEIIKYVEENYKGINNSYYNARQQYGL